MKKNSTKKLQLRKNTIARLGKNELQHQLGGAFPVQPTTTAQPTHYLTNCVPTLRNC